MKDKLKIIIIIILFPMLIISGLKIKEYSKFKYYESTYTLNNTGNTYEEQLRNIHDTYPPEFYEYINETNIFEQKFIGFEKQPENLPWKFSLTCKDKEDEENLLCYSAIGFKEKGLWFNISHFPPKDDEIYYDIKFEFLEGEFTNYKVQSSNRLGAYAICTFKDAELTEPVNKIEKYDEPNYDEYPMSPYGEVNCYEEGKLYQDIVPLLEELEEKTVEKMKQLIGLSEKYKNLSDKEVQKLRDDIRLEE